MGKKRPGFCAGSDNHLFGIDLQLALLPRSFSDQLAQTRNARGWVVPCLASLDGIYPGLADLGKSIEIRLADFKVNNMPAVRFQRLGFGHHRVRPLGF